MRKRIGWLVAGFAALIAASALVFHLAFGLSPLDALYFVVTTVTTVGYGDYTFKEAAGPLKVYGILLMLAGPCFMAVLFGVITERLLAEKLAAFLGRRPSMMRDHVVVCGLGQLGYRIVTQLRQLEEPVVVVERDDQAGFAAAATKLGASVILDDCRQREVLENAGLATAKAVIVATNDDLANLKTAAAVRGLRPDIRIVLRMFDQEFAERIEGAFSIDVAMSSTAISAPSFVTAALEPRPHVKHAFCAGSQLIVTAEVEVDANSPLAGRSVGALRTDAQVSVVHLATSDGAQTPCPGDGETLAPGVTAVLVGTKSRLDQLLDEPTATS